MELSDSSLQHKLSLVVFFFSASCVCRGALQRRCPWHSSSNICCLLIGNITYLNVNHGPVDLQEIKSPCASWQHKYLNVICKDSQAVHKQQIKQCWVTWCFTAVSAATCQRHQGTARPVWPVAPTSPADVDVSGCAENPLLICRPCKNNTYCAWEIKAG